jgi:hypothetical protein
MKLGPRLKDAAKPLIRYLSHWHTPDPESAPVFVFSTPRSGSTWLTELFLSQPGFKPCDEPFNLRVPEVRRALGIGTWEQLYDPANTDRIRHYLEGFILGRRDTAFKNLLPTQKHYRFRTRRTVFKILHALEDRIDWVQATFQAHVYYLIRHPIPVALSRELAPRLRAFLNSHFADRLHPEQRRLARQILSRGDPLECKLADWCLQNVVALQNHAACSGLITYEQLVLEPKPVVERLRRETRLPDKERLQAQLYRPSRSVSKSKPETAEALRSNQTDRDWLILKWKKHVDETLERHLMDLVAEFGITIYQTGSARPRAEYWIESKTALPRDSMHDLTTMGTQPS